MSDLYNSNSKKISEFTAQSLLQDSDIFTLVRNSTNYNIRWSDLKLDLGVSGSLSTAGAPTATPILQNFGSDYSIRGLESTKGIVTNLSAQNGVNVSCNFAQVGGGETIIKDLNASQYEFKTMVAGEGVSITDTGNALRFDFLADTTTTKTVVISEESDFPDPAGGVITLEPSTDYVIVNDITTSNRFITQAPNTIRASSSQMVTLTYTGVDDMFSGTDVSLKIRDITLNCPNGNVFNTTSPGGFGIVQMVEANVENCQTIGQVENNFITRFTNTAFENIIAGGLLYKGTNTIMVVDVSVGFLGGGSLIDLGTSTFQTVSISGGVIPSSSPGTFFLSGLPNSGNIVAGGLGTVFNNTGFGSGAPLNGITSSDVRWNFLANNSISNTISDALVYTDGNALETVITAANTPVKVNAVFTEQDAARFTTDASGTCTYIGEVPSRLPIDVTISMVGASGGDKQATVYIAINGSVISATSMQTTINSAKSGAATAIWQYNFQPNDYVEVFVENNSDTVNIVATNVVLRIN